MRVSIERLQVLLLVGASLLVVTIAAFLGYAHLRAHQFLRDLPGRLGANISRESNGFMYSQSGKGGRTIYTIHAAKLVQFKDGKTTLHDVGIVLYGQKQDRADRIYGSEFEYDQKAGVVRARGEVHLDLQAPAPTDAQGRAEYAAGRETGAVSGGGKVEHSGNEHGGDAHGGEDEQMVHVKTSGLVFVQSLGVASTEQEIEFQYHGLTGKAKGADYNSDTGVTVLQSEVRVSGLREGQPVLLTAAHAEIDRGKGEMRLDRARYVSGGEGERAKANERTMTVERAVVHLRAGGSVERVVGSGGVSLAQGGGVLRGQTADVAVSPESRPETAHLSGGLTYTEDGDLRQVQGRAGQGTARFDAGGRIASAVMTEAAEIHVRERASEAGMWSDRTVAGDRIDLRFAVSGDKGSGPLRAGERGAGGRQWLHDLTAAGRARMLLVDRSDKDETVEETTSELRGDTLAGQMVWDGRSGRLSHVSGVGHTALRRSDTEGGVDTSEGERLEVSLGPAAASNASRATSGGAERAIGAQGATTVLSAVQSGGVTLTHMPARRSGEMGGARPDGASTGGARRKDGSVVRATAERASFTGEGQTLTLSGQAQVTEGDSLLRAETVTVRRDTGDAMAEGAVKVSYRQTGSADPVHVSASRADLKHDTGLATFFGGSAAAARLWQGASQVEAAVIEFNQAEKTLVARTSGSSDSVRTVLVGGRGTGGAGVGRAGQQVMRVSSRSLRYSDADRRADFGGGVVLQEAGATVRGSQMVALLKPARTGGAAESSAAGPAGFMGGSVDRVTAEGAVEVSERGRRASGEKLVYTAADGIFVMTGTPAASPKVVDEVQGTTTGAALQFHAGDNSVMILGEKRGGEGRRVHTETPVRQR